MPPLLCIKHGEDPRDCGCAPPGIVDEPSQPSSTKVGSKFAKAGRPAVLARFDGRCVACSGGIIEGEHYIRRAEDDDGWEHASMEDCE